MSEHGGGARPRGLPGRGAAQGRRAPAGVDQPAPTAAMWLGRAMIVLGWALILSGFGLFGWECVMWLRDGHWTRSDLADLWGHLPPGGGEAVPPGWQDMRGLHLIVYEILRALGRVPVGVALFAAGLALAWSGNDCHDRAEARLLRAARRRVRAD